MSIYAEKNRKGVLTGWFRIEVQSRGHRLRDRASDMRKATLIERQLTDRISKMAVGEPAPMPRGPAPLAANVTFGQALRRARGVLWADGGDHELTSFRKLRRVASIVGDDLPIDLFDTNTLDTVMQAISDGGAAPSTLNRYLSAISKFLEFCTARGIKTTVGPTMEWRKEEKKRIRWLSYAEEAELMRLLPSPFSEITYCAIRTGMRVNEILTLKPEQIEDRWCHLWKTKNNTARSIPLNDDLRETLAKLVEDGMPTYPQMRHHWDMARKTMGLTDDETFVFHSTRHTFATRAVQANVHIRMLQMLMGHQTINTTLRYAHVDDKDLADSAISALAFHDDCRVKLQGNIGQKPRPAPRGAIRNRRSLPFENRSVPIGYCKSSHAGSIPARASTENQAFNDD
jgi:integrase